MTELKPCPFCGYEWPTLVRNGFKAKLQVECFSCTATGPAQATEEQAVNVWNARSPENKQSKIVRPALSLGEALPLEQARVRNLILQYRDPELNGAGAIAAAMMEQSLRAADAAVMSGDIVAMIEAYRDLKEYK
jgi:Lar family restriction alleviation protein